MKPRASADFSVGVPLNDVLVLNRDFALDGHNGIEPLSLAGPSMSMPIVLPSPERNAIGQVACCGNRAAFSLANIAKTPLDEMDG